MFFTRIAPQEVVPEPVALIRACDLSAVIPDSFTPEFLTALLDRVAVRKAYLKAHPVSTAGSQWQIVLNIQNRQTEMARLQGIYLDAALLLEPADCDELDLEIAASDLAAYLDEDGGQLERQAIAVVEGRNPV